MQIFGTPFSKALSGIILNALYPPHCALCDALISPGADGICEDCAKRLRFLQPPLCVRCGKQLDRTKNHTGGLCRDCKERRHRFDKGYALFAYRDVAPALYRFKYMGRREYAAFFAKAFLIHYDGLPGEVRYDALIPVPLSAKRLRKRGYNQAQLLAQELSRRTHVPLRTDILMRIRDTKPQKCLDYYERRNNLKNAFIMKKNDVSLKSVALVDDIYTTGSTADEIAALLKGSGVQRVDVLVPAIGNTSLRVEKRRKRNGRQKLFEVRKDLQLCGRTADLRDMQKGAGAGLPEGQGLHQAKPE